MNILLTGAGFSRNWGGWLASEAFEYLLGAPEVDDELRRILLADKLKDRGFEDTLADLQTAFKSFRDPKVGEHVDALTAALVGMFNLMDQAFATVRFEPQNDRPFLVSEFLARFDAIFTLNQDLLLERHYLNGNVELAANRRWKGWQRPGLKPLQPASSHDYGPQAAVMAMQTPDDANFTVAYGLQPYFKLHGSSNFLRDPGGRIIVMGGNKAAGITDEPLLRWYQQQFEDYLDRAEKLMVIGYSFTDPHINQAIQSAAARGLRIFIVDPEGIDVLDKNKRMAIKVIHPLVEHIAPYVVGASRRSVTSTFGGDHVEFTKLDRFLNS
jgi:hypothetical protein